MKPSEIDDHHLKLIREDINRLLCRAAELYDGEGVTVLEIGPGEYEGARKAFKKATVKTLDIDQDSGADYIADIAGRSVADYYGMADVVICTDVLEHTENPFRAIENISDILGRRKRGALILSVPLNYRIHGMGGYHPKQGPPPDYWRFTEQGLRLLLSEFEILEFDALESDRALFPIHYNVIARKK